MTKPLPEGYVLEEGYDMPVEKSAWTVGDLMTMLADYPEDTIVWIDRSPVRSKFESDEDYFAAPYVVAPIETVSGHNGMVVLG